MSGRSQPDHHESSARVTEPWDRASPVLLVAEFALPFSRHAFSIPDESGTPSATDHLASNRFERVGHDEGQGSPLLELPPEVEGRHR